MDDTEIDAPDAESGTHDGDLTPEAVAAMPVAAWIWALDTEEEPPEAPRRRMAGKMSATGYRFFATEAAATAAFRKAVDVWTEHRLSDIDMVRDAAGMPRVADDATRALLDLDGLIAQAQACARWSEIADEAETDRQQAIARADAAEKRVAEWERRYKEASEESLTALREALDTAQHISALHATAIKERDTLKDERFGILVALMDCAQIGAHLRFDAWRAEGAPPWTAWIPGKGRGDGQTPAEAVASLKADLKSRKEKPHG